MTWFIESVVILPRKGTIHVVSDHECEWYVCLQWMLFTSGYELKPQGRRR